jgi:predicted ATPase/transcriptional regulator with XRE-family HTH domain
LNDASFGRMVKRLRKSLDLTQRDLARRVGYSVVTIRKVESDERRPSRELAERLARFLDVAQEELPGFLALARTLVSEASPHGDQLVEPWRRSQPAEAWWAAGPPTNLTVPLTRLIGRHTEVAAVSDLLTREDIRLVTLVGPPGIGKTRLSVQVATDLLAAFPDGVFSVALAPISDPALVTPTIAKTLGVKDSVAQPLVDCLVDYLRHRSLLLVLDNFEHMLASAAELTAVLTACPRLTVLATSRQPLHLRGERLYSVPPLGLPDSQQPVTAAAAARYPAIELFIERAQAADHTFRLTDANVKDVTEICANLEGLPLAIELVAARIVLLAPQALLNRLDSRLSLLTGGPRDLPKRQQTLRDTIDWSYQLLDAGQQALFARLAVFIGGCRLEAAEQVANTDGTLPEPVLDGLAALADQHLLRQEERGDGQRYCVFFETIREFALERLDSRGEAGQIRQRYAEYYLALAETANRHLTGREQETWLDRLEAEHNNLRAVIEYHLHNDEAAAALRMVAALWRFWHVHSHQTEGGRWIALSLALGGPHDPRHRAQVLNGAGWIATDQSDQTHAMACFTESLALYRAIGDQRGIAEALHGVGGQVQTTGNDARAVALFSESLELYRQLGDREGIAWSMDHLGYAALYLDDPDRALELFEQSSEIFRELEHTWGSAISLHHQGLTFLARHDHQQAEQRLREGLERFEELGNSWGIAQSFYHLGHVALCAGEADKAQSYLLRSLALDQTEEDRTGVIRSLAGLANAAVAQGRFSRAACLFGAVETFAITNPIRQTPPELTIYTRDITIVRSRLGEPAMAAAWRSGCAMTLLEAASFAAAGASPYQANFSSSAAVTQAEPHRGSPDGWRAASVSEDR